MNFLQQIKKAINPNNYRGTYRAPIGYELVPTHDIRELVASFESLDAIIRADEAMKRPADEDNFQLACLIARMWHTNGKQADRIMFVFSDELQRLLKEDLKNKPRQMQTHGSRREIKGSN